MTLDLERRPAPRPEDAGLVPATVSRHVGAAGFDLVLDLDRSRGSWLVDARDGTAYLDMFTFFGSSALGMNHPAITDDAAFAAELARAARHKPSNADLASPPLAAFLQTFARVAGDPELPHLFLIEGGSAAVENALKVAFDWKSRHNEAHGRSPTLGTRVLHLTDAFHGRGGYALSVTNTEPVKTARYPVFDWPRLRAPYLSPGRDVEAAERATLAAARSAFAAHPHDIACFLLEPIQGEGGDHHFRPEFLAAMAALCREHDALVVADEVQCGMGITGSMWAHQQLGLRPDVVAFGKKAQVCGVMAGRRVDEVDDNVFRVRARLGSTWSGGLADMVRARRILEVIDRDGLVARAARLGGHLAARLDDLAGAVDGVTDPRGRGLMRAFSLPDRATRDAVLHALFTDERVVALGSGRRSVRFRPALTVTADELDAVVDAVARVLARVLPR